MKNPLLGLAYLVTIFLINHTAAANSLDVFGRYLTEEKNSHVEIIDCGDGSPCGTVVWLDKTMLPEGVTPETAKSKKGEKVLGLKMLQGFERKKDDWRDGTIYAPGKGKTYKSRLKRLDDGNLEVKGCIAFLCQTQIWTPVDS